MTTTTPPPTFDQDKAWKDFKRLWFLKILTMLWFLLVLGAAAYAIGAAWNEWWPYAKLHLVSAQYQKVAIYTFAGGVIGSALYAFHGFCVAVGPQRPDIREYHYDPNWTWWYVASPPIGGFVGAFTYVVVRTGIATLGTATTDSKSNLAYFGIAALAGLSSRAALNWLGSKAKGTFGTGGGSGKDGTGGNGGGGGGGGGTSQAPAQRPTANTGPEGTVEA